MTELDRVQREVLDDAAHEERLQHLDFAAAAEQRDAAPSRYRLSKTVPKNRPLRSTAAIE